MIKVNTLGMFDVAKIDPTIKLEEDIKNNQFVTVDEDLFLVMNEPNGDDSYRDDVVLKAGECLNGFLLSAWVGQELVVDSKHITYKHSENYEETLTAGKFLKVGGDKNLETSETAPESGIYFKVVAKEMLTEKAVRVKIMDAGKAQA